MLHIFLQEIPLSEILQVIQPRDFSNMVQGSNPHCFEIITDTMVYFVGENIGSSHHSPVLAATGVGLDVAQGWEKAIRQALMPVTPQASVCTAPGQGKDHSKQADKALLFLYSSCNWYRLHFKALMHIINAKHMFAELGPFFLWTYGIWSF